MGGTVAVKGVLFEAAETGQESYMVFISSDQLLSVTPHRTRGS